MKRIGVCNRGERDGGRGSGGGTGRGGREKRERESSSSQKSYRKGVGFLLLIYLCVFPTEISVLLLGLGTTVSSACYYTVHVQHVTYMYMYPIPGG